MGDKRELKNYDEEKRYNRLINKRIKNKEELIVGTKFILLGLDPSSHKEFSQYLRAFHRFLFFLY